ncbi:hypothetical protein MBLNU457_2071t1 [Dothideomycetes sp. NU457]
MSATRNTDAVSNSLAGGEGFQPSVPRDEPLSTTGHKPGVMTSEADHKPEFNAKTMPAGSAPSSETFKPNNASEVPPVPGQADKETQQYSAQATMPGATSADVHTGLGHPGQGQTSQELRHDGSHSNKKGGSGITGVASGAQSYDTVDKHDPSHADQRVIDKEGVELKNELGGPSVNDKQ